MSISDYDPHQLIAAGFAWSDSCGWYTTGGRTMSATITRQRIIHSVDAPVEDIVPASELTIDYGDDGLFVIDYQSGDDPHQRIILDEDDVLAMADAIKRGQPKEIDNAGK